MADARAAASQVVGLAERGQLSQAEAALEKALARHADSDAVATARLYVLIEQGHVAAARAAAEALTARQPPVTHPETVSLLVKTLQRGRLWEPLARTYERLAAAAASSTTGAGSHSSSGGNSAGGLREQQVLENLALVYVRMGAYSRAQQTAQQAFAKFKDPRYQVWVVQAMLAQVPPPPASVLPSSSATGADTAGGGGGGVITDNMLLKLATRLLDTRVLTEAGKLVPGTARTYVDVLCAQGMYEEAEAFLLSARGAAVGLAETRLEVLAQTYLAHDRHRRRAEAGGGAAAAAAPASHAAAVNAIGLHLWRAFPDNWTYFSLYRDTLLNDDDDSGEAGAGAAADGSSQPPLLLQLLAEGPEAADRAVTIDVSAAAAAAHRRRGAALALCRELQAAQRAERPGKLSRGPFMAELALLADELAAQQHATAAAAAAAKEAAQRRLREAVVAYAAEFYRKPCCYLDLSTFLTTETAAAVRAWAEAENASGDDSAGEESLEAHTRRILALRCVVACWPLAAEDADNEHHQLNSGNDGSSSSSSGSGSTGEDGAPTEEEMLGLMAECRRRYEAARPLSAHLAWSEEGLCDGYINVGLNIALYGYCRARGATTGGGARQHRYRDPHASDAAACAPQQQQQQQRSAQWWAAEGLRLLHGVHNRSSNPSWLLLSVALCRLAGGGGGLCDVAALHQLAFKSVQHDTMTHLGFLPLRAALALEEVARWGERAEEYYERLAADCALMRAKVFMHLSWPAMAEVREFERRQTRSLARLAHTAEHCVAQLRGCQTQRNVCELMALFTEELADACRRAAAPAPADPSLLPPAPQCGGGPETEAAGEALVDNTDWTVVRSLILGDIHSAKVRRMARALVPTPPPAARLAAVAGTLHALALLHDVCARAQHAQACRSTKTRRDKKKGGGAAEAASAAVPEPTLLLPQLRKDGVPLAPVPPVLAPFVAPLTAFIAGGDAGGKGEADAPPSSPAAVVRELCGSPTGEEEEEKGQKSARVDPQALESLLYPDLCIAAVLLQVCPLPEAPGKGSSSNGSASIPVKEWAAELAAAVQQAAASYSLAPTTADLCDHHYHDNTTTSTTTGTVKSDGEDERDAQLAALTAAKERQVLDYARDLCVQLKSCANRKV